RDAAALVDAGEVSVNGAPRTDRSSRVDEGDELAVRWEARDEPAPAGDAAVDVPVVFVDDDIIVVDKPPGLVVHPGAGNPAGTLVHGLLARFPEIASLGDPARPGVVH